MSCSTGNLQRSKLQRPPNVSADTSSYQESSPDAWPVGCRVGGYRVALDPTEEIGMAQERCEMWVPDMSSPWWRSQARLSDSPEGRRGSWPDAAQPSPANCSSRIVSGPEASLKGAEGPGLQASPRCRSQSSTDISPLARRLLTRQLMQRARGWHSDAALDSSSSDEEGPAAEPADICYSREYDDEKLGGCYAATE